MAQLCPDLVHRALVLAATAPDAAADWIEVTWTNDRRAGISKRPRRTANRDVSKEHLGKVDRPPEGFGGQAPGLPVSLRTEVEDRVGYNPHLLAVEVLKRSVHDGTRFGELRSPVLSQLRHERLAGRCTVDH